MAVTEGPDRNRLYNQGRCKFIGIPRTNEEQKALIAEKDPIKRKALIKKFRGTPSQHAFEEVADKELDKITKKRQQLQKQREEKLRKEHFRVEELKKKETEQSKSTEDGAEDSVSLSSLSLNQKKDEYFLKYGEEVPENKQDDEEWINEQLVKEDDSQDEEQDNNDNTTDIEKLQKQYEEVTGKDLKNTPAKYKEDAKRLQKKIDEAKK